MQSDDAKLEAAFDDKQHTARRRVKGQEMEPRRLSVNGRDLAAELLDPLVTNSHRR